MRCSMSPVRDGPVIKLTVRGIAPRIRHLIENDQNARICPETYDKVDTRNLVEPPSSRMAIVGMIFAGFTLAVLISSDEVGAPFDV